MTGLSLDIAANTRAAQSNVRDLSKALDETSDALDDVARDSGRSADKVEGSFREMVRASEKAGRDIANDARDAADKVERAYRDAGDAGGDSFGRIKRGAGELQQEVGQNLGEAVSSVRDNFSDLGQVGQDTLGGLAATLSSAGPTGLVGAAALAAGAVGLGAITAEFQKQQEEADALRERISGIYRQAIDDGRDYIDTASLIAEANSVMFDPERADEWKRLQEQANELGLDRATMIAANAGDLDSIAQVQERINGLIDDERAKREANPWNGQNKTVEEQRLEAIAQSWQQAADVALEYQQKIKDAAAVSEKLHQDERDQIDRTNQAARDRYQGLADLMGNPIKTTVEVEVDDSKWRGWTPSVKWATVKATPGAGTVLKNWD